MNPANLVVSAAEWKALMPMLIVAGGAMFSLLVATLNFGSGAYRKLPVFGTGLVTLIAATVSAISNWSSEPVRALQGLVIVDHFSSFCFALVSICGILVLLAGYRYLEDEAIHYSEYYCILLCSILGMMSLVAATELVAMFIALELMSLAIYVLVGMRRLDALSNEAAAKYFVMGGLGSALFLYGVALLYGATNSTNLADISILIRQGTVTLTNPVLVVGVALIFVGFLFKVAVAPFHMWTPDVYQGAPIVVTSFMSTALKAAAFAAFARVVGSLLGSGKEAAEATALAATFHGMLWWLSLATMVVGNFVALLQQNVKRMLAYSAIAHTGYLMLGLLVGPAVGFSSILVYLVPYSVMNIGAFAVLSLFVGKEDREASVERLTGMGYRYPLLGGAMTIFLFSLSGLPPTGGFIGKYFLFSAGLQAGETVLVLLAVLTSVVSVFYYLRVVVYMYMREDKAGVASREVAGVSPFVIGAVLACVIVVLQVGVAPGFLLEMARKAASF